MVLALAVSTVTSTCCSLRSTLINASQAAHLILRLGQYPTGSAFSSRLPDAVAVVLAAPAALAGEPAALPSAAAVRASAPFFVSVAGDAVPSAVFAHHSDAVARPVDAPGPAAAALVGVPALASGTSCPAAAGISDPPCCFRCSADGPVDWSSAIHSDARKSAGFHHSHDLHLRSADGHCDFLAAFPDDCSPDDSLLAYGSSTAACYCSRGDCCQSVDWSLLADCSLPADYCRCGLPRHDWDCSDRDLAAGCTDHLPAPQPRLRH